jgi:hypothetical protein
MRIPQVTDRMRRAPVHALRAVFTGIGQMFVAADRLKEQAGQSAAPATAGQARSAAGGNVPGQDRRHGPAGPAGSAGPGWSSRRSSASFGGAPGATKAPASDHGARGAAKPGAPAKSGRGSGRSRKPGAAPAETRWRSLDQTGNVRLLSAEDLALEYPTTPAATPTPAPRYSFDEPEPEPAADALPEPSEDIDITLEAEPVPLDPELTASAVPEPPAAELPLPNYDELSLPSLRARLRNLDADQLRTLADYERSHAARDDVVMMFTRRIEKLAAEG